jgi:hypothetical protein
MASTTFSVCRATNRLVEPVADEVRVRRAETQAPVVRRYTETRYGARSWHCESRVAARIEATQGLDIRYVVTNITGGSAEWPYDVLYYARSQAENLIKLHKTQLASDRTSCRSPLANRCASCCTGAYWLMLKPRDAIPRPQPLATAEFATLRMRPDQDRRLHRRNPKPGARRLRRGASRDRHASPASRAVCNPPGREPEACVPDLRYVPKLR